MSVEIHSTSALDLISGEAALTELGNGFGFVEGPAWHPDGYLLFTDIAGNAILRWDEAGGVKDWLRPSSHANGLVVRRDGVLVLCEHDRSVVRCLHPDGSEEILASHFEGCELNSPNDLAVSSDGSVLFTDPHPAGRTTAWGVERPQELDFNGVFHVSSGGELTLLARDPTFPNGVCLSPDESVVYFNDSVEMSIDAIEVGPGWTFGERTRLVVQGPSGRIEGGNIVPDSDTEVGFPDGMRCDEHGNIWCTGPGGIWIVSSSGDHLATIRTPEFAANLAWGGDQGRQLFVTASTRLFRLDTLVRGAYSHF